MADEKTKPKKKKVRRTVTVVYKTPSATTWTVVRVPIKAWREILLSVGREAKTMAEALNGLGNQKVCEAAHDVTEWDAARALAELAKVIP
jgi:hypothetical protein